MRFADGSGTVVALLKGYTATVVVGAAGVTSVSYLRIGSKDDPEESFRDTAIREVFEETGIACGPGTPLADGLADWALENVYDIYPQWRHRYAAGVTRNTEHLFGLRVAAGTAILLHAREHTAYRWMPWQAAAEACFSPSNAEAVLMLPRFVSRG